MSSLASCIFCKIIKGGCLVSDSASLADISVGEIPSMKLLDTESVFAFMDIGPIAKGHCLVIPKYHAAKLVDLPDDQMSEILPTCKRLAQAYGAENFNVLQNNGRAAHQVVDHVHFHMIPKPADGGDKEGLVIGWPTQTDLSKEEITKVFDEMKGKL